MKKILVVTHSLPMSVKSFKDTHDSELEIRQESGEGTSVKFLTLKRILDVAISVLIILALSPVLLVIHLIAKRYSSTEMLQSC